MTQDSMSALETYPAAEVEQLTSAFNAANEAVGNWLAANGVPAPGDYFGLTQRLDLLKSVLKPGEQVFDEAFAAIAAHDDAKPAN